MRDSIIQDMKFAEYDLITGGYPVERHHVCGGTGNRRVSDDDGLWVSLTKSHHTEGIQPKGIRCDAHHCRIMHDLLAMLGQASYERDYYKERLNMLTGKNVDENPARDEFRKKYGKSYL